MAIKKPSAYLLYIDDMESIIECLDNTNLGELIRALHNGVISGQIQKEDVSPALATTYLMMGKKMLRDVQHYGETCEKRRASALSRYHKDDEETDVQMHANASDCKQTQVNKKETERKEKEKENQRERETKKACAPNAPFVPPTPMEVEDYTLSQGRKLDGERFCNYHIAKGWTVGSAPMKDWRAVARLWMQDDLHRAASPPEKRSRQVNAHMYTQRTYTEKDLSFNDNSLFEAAEAKMKTGELT